jgi:hypothetical protein
MKLRHVEGPFNVQAVCSSSSDERGRDTVKGMNREQTERAEKRRNEKEFREGKMKKERGGKSIRLTSQTCRRRRLFQFKVE